MSYQHIRYEMPEPYIAVVTLNRPERLNALHGPLMLELMQAVQAIEQDEAVRVFLLTGAPRADGRPCFSAGVDLKASAEGKAIAPGLGLDLTNAIDDLLKPSIAVIDGVCTTGAAEIALACDLRLVSATAQISDWHLKNLGTGTGGWGASTRWSRLVGPAKAKELILTGKVIGGEEAHRIGFASAAHPPDTLMAEAMAMARAIAGMKPEGVRLTLAHIDRNMDMSRDQALRWAQLAGKWFNVHSGIGERGAEILEQSKQQPS